MVCAKCNQELAADARFCPQCGAPVLQAAGIEVKQDMGSVSGEIVGGDDGRNIAGRRGVAN